MNNQILIKDTALKTIEIEAEAIKNLQSSINQDFIDAVSSINVAKGRVIITGIGKSAIVGQKIVATLNSTGTPSLFLHAADAIHGDIGMVQSDDIVICISKSGETPEIKALLPLIRNRGNLVIGMTANAQSSLAYNSKYLLYTPIEKEADPNNLAPTTSTTSQMVMGDALATALLVLRGFSPKDFALSHPGGALGKQFYLKVIDVCHGHEQPSVNEDASLKEVIIEITKKRLGATVVKHDKHVVGIITDGDLRRMLEAYENFDKLTAKDIMSKHPKVISSDELAIEALALMRQHSITQLIVLQDSAYVGIIHLHDLLREGLI
ncbi:MAG: KpsF/GutQ family sugar-phosphate isomerase [Saprospiraceae bacterium]|nr:KpsF/GutQ family sugar-phosphate isomerase [Saprospiraceae bacterium]